MYTKIDYVKLALIVTGISIVLLFAVSVLFNLINSTIINATSHVIIAPITVTNLAYAEEISTTTTTSLATVYTGNLTGLVTHIVDGDTLDLDINGTISRIRFSLVNTPERGEPGYKEAKNFVAQTCPVGSTALLDMDNKQKPSFGRIVGVIYCSNSNSSTSSKIVNINSELLTRNYAKVVTRFCDISEFAERSWIVEQCNSSSINNNNPSSSSSLPSSTLVSIDTRVSSSPYNTTITITNSSNNQTTPEEKDSLVPVPYSSFCVDRKTNNTFEWCENVEIKNNIAWYDFNVYDCIGEDYIQASQRENGTLYYPPDVPIAPTYERRIADDGHEIC